MTSDDELNQSLNSFLKQRNLSIHIDNELDL